MILVDSSVWIEAWRGVHQALTDRLSQEIENENVSINLLIQTELLQGAKDLKHQKSLKTLLDPISIDPFPEDLWEETPKLFLQCRQKGIQMTTIDCLIASHALLRDIPLWSLDKDFQRVPNLVLFKTDIPS